MASFVFFRKESSGETFKLRLSRDGKVDVDNALAAIGLPLVKWKDDDGVVCVLEKEEEGSKSVHVFEPGQTIVFQPCHRQEQAQLPLYLNRQPLDINQVEISAELVAEMEMEAFNVCGPGLHTWAEWKTGKWRTDNTDVLYMLFKVQAEEELFIGNPDTTWKERYSSEKQSAHLSQLDAWMNLHGSSSFTWLEPHKVRQYGRVFQAPRNLYFIGSKTDGVLVEKSLGVGGAVLGVELVTKLSWRGLFRSQLDYYLWASSSTMPYVQLHTDMVTGGIAHFCVGSVDEQSDIWMLALQNKQELEEFIREFGKVLPLSVRDFSSQDYEELLGCKYPFPGTEVNYIVLPP